MVEGPNQRKERKGDPFENSTLRLRQFVLDNPRLREFRTIFDKLPNKEELTKNMHEMSEDFEASEFFTANIDDEEDCDTVREIA